LLALCLEGQQALRACDEAIRLDPTFAPPHNARGNELARVGRLEDALGAYDEAIRLSPDFAKAHSNRGAVLLDLGRLQDATRSCREAIRLDPDLAWPHDVLGDILRRLGRMQEALAAYDEAIRLEPEYFPPYVGRGLVLEAADRLQDALAEYDEAIRLDPQKMQLHTRRGRCLVALGRRADAVTSLLRAIELGSDDALEARVLLAALIRRDDPGQSADLCRTALLSQVPFQSPFRRAELRALAYLLVDDPEAAAAELREAEPARLPGDQFQRPLYDLFDDPRVPGLEQLLAIWSEIDPAIVAS
jgi:tetratricopeptide (TPR) repeat protein